MSPLEPTRVHGAMYRHLCAYSLCVLSIIFPTNVRALQAAFQFTGVVKAHPAVLEANYANKSKETQCIKATDFRGHGFGGMFHIVSEDGTVVKYIGRVADVSDPNALMPYFILRPGESITAEFELEGNYDLKVHNKYKLSYFLAITDCAAIISGELNSFDIPSVGIALGFINLPADEDNWNQRLEILPTVFSKWSKVGFLAELTVEFVYEH